MRNKPSTFGEKLAMGFVAVGVVVLLGWLVGLVLPAIENPVLNALDGFAKDAPPAMFAINDGPAVPFAYRELAELPADSQMWTAPDGFKIRLSDQPKQVVIEYKLPGSRKAEVSVDTSSGSSIAIDGYKVIIFGRQDIHGDYHYWLQILRPVWW